MSHLADLQRQMASMDELQDIVRAMRTLAVMRLQEAQAALPGIRTYAASVARAMGAALQLLPKSSAPQSPAAPPTPGASQRALIVWTSEQGFVGGFNERLVDATLATLRTGDQLFVLGTRGTALLRERGCAPHWTDAIATRTASAGDTVGRVVTQLYSRLSRGEIARVDIMVACYGDNGITRIDRHGLLPLDVATLSHAATDYPPDHHLEPAVLMEGLAAEYVFALLMQTTVESIASENAARFRAMESARDNVSKKLSQLTQSSRDARQGEITEELLDLMIGTQQLL